MSWPIVSYPSDENIVPSTDLGHIQMLSPAITHVKLTNSGFCDIGKPLHSVIYGILPAVLMTVDEPVAAQRVSSSGGSRTWGEMGSALEQSIVRRYAGKKAHLVSAASKVHPFYDYISSSCVGYHVGAMDASSVHDAWWRERFLMGSQSTRWP